MSDLSPDLCRMRVCRTRCYQRGEGLSLSMRTCVQRGLFLGLRRLVGDERDDLLSCASNNLAGRDRARILLHVACVVLILAAVPLCWWFGTSRRCSDASHAPFPRAKDFGNYSYGVEGSGDDVDSCSCRSSRRRKDGVLWPRCCVRCREVPPVLVCRSKLFLPSLAAPLGHVTVHPNGAQGHGSADRLRDVQDLVVAVLRPAGLRASVGAQGLLGPQSGAHIVC